MKRTLSAAAVLACASPASAFLIYDGFDYAENSNLVTAHATDYNLSTGQTNPFGQPWAAAGASDTDNPLVFGPVPGLSLSGIPASTGRAISIGNLGTAARIEVGPFEATSPLNTIYYSFALQITDPATLAASTSVQGGQWAGFNTLKGKQPTVPSQFGTRLHLRQSGTDPTGMFSLNLSKNGQVNSASWMDLAVNTTYMVVGSYTINPDLGNDVARMWVYADPTAAAGLSDAPAAHLESSTAGGNDLTTGRIESFVIRQSGPAAAPPSGVVIDELRVDTSWAGVVPAPSQDWVGAGDGNWSDGTKWAGGTAPDAAGKYVKFKGAAAPVTVTVDTPHTVGTIDLDAESGAGYTLAGPAALTVSTNSSINAYKGDHTIAAPLTAGGNLTFNVAPAATLAVSEQVTTSPGAAFPKTGYGNVTVKNVRADHLVVYAGKVIVADNGTADGMSIVKSLQLPQHFLAPPPPDGINVLIPPIGSIDFRDNDVIVDYAPGGPSPEFALRDLVKRTIDGNPTGIFFTPGAGDVALAFAEKTEWGFSSFNGVALDDTTVIGKYTYYGDSNLDGAVTSDDYVAVDVGLGTGDSWVQGDFNFSGTVTSDDYVAIDVNLGKGTPTPLAWAELKAEMIALHTEMFGAQYVEKLAYAEANGFAATLVPEPGAPSVVGLGAIGLLGRRRRGA